MSRLDPLDYYKQLLTFNTGKYSSTAIQDSEPRVPNLSRLREEQNSVSLFEPET